MVEHRTFPETCKVEHLATSVDQVMAGKRSQFINRRLSYGLVQSGSQALAAMQISAEGSVVIFLQAFFGRQDIMLWLTFMAFLVFLVSLVSVVMTLSDWVIVRLGMMDQDLLDSATRPIADLLRNWLTQFGYDYFENMPPNLMDDYLKMGIEYILWIAGMIVFLAVFFFVTEVLKGFRACGCFRRCKWPSEMRWWARLLIRMHQITFFLWWWLPLFWIGFNYYTVFTRQTYHFSPVGMFAFIIIIQVLTWGLTAAASLRQTLQASMGTNEVVSLSMDNVWRSAQGYYITAPLILYSIIKGMQDYSRYHFYGQDISFSTGEERAVMAKSLVKVWTLLLVLGAVVAWIHYAFYGRHLYSLASCIIVTIIALDVLHPCAYLWVGQVKMTDQQASSLTWCQALTSGAWWERSIRSLVLNSALGGCIKWLGPACFISLPFVIFVLPFMGVNLAFMMLTGTTNL